ncbi:MAG: hypothetical protein H6753_00865 [Candidatus Omnitrophica bacterium]|nr:hypothetical protein [Candidatus Omnitrophota bacterium]
MKYNFLFLCLLSGLICTPLACAPQNVPQKVSLTSAQEKFLKLCHEELKYEVSVFPKGKTLWVYVPLSDNISILKAAPKNQTPPADTIESWSINFLKSTFENKTFVISYDITPTKKYDQPLTYKNSYSDEYSKKQREVLTALTRAYFDVGQKNIDSSLTVGNQADTTSDKPLVKNIAEGILPPEKEAAPPEFFVTIFADIKNGVAVKTTNYFEDMRMALSNPPAISNDEYAKRFVYEILGDEKMIGNTTGTNLEMNEIILSDFLAKQIETRIKYQFTQSNFPPTGQVLDEIWTIVGETCRLYQFKDFEKIKLIDLQTQKESTFDKSQL